jgi:hypothetical protein
MKTLDAFLRRFAEHVLNQLSNRELDRRDTEISIDAMIVTLQALKLVQKTTFQHDVRVWLANADLKQLLVEVLDQHALEQFGSGVDFDEDGDPAGYEDNDDDYPCLLYCASEAQRRSLPEAPKKKKKSATT